MKRCAVELLQKGNYYEMTAFVSLFLLCLLVSNDSLVMSYNFFSFILSKIIVFLVLIVFSFVSAAVLLSSATLILINLIYFSKNYIRIWITNKKKDDFRAHLLMTYSLNWLILLWRLFRYLFPNI